MKRTEFNELIEKAFSMGYECALEERMYSDDEKKKKMSMSDRFDVWAWKHLSGKKRRDSRLNEIEEKESLGKLALKEGAKDAIPGALLGAAAGYVKTGKKSGAGLGAAAGAAGFGGVSALGTAATVGLRRSLRKKSKSYDNAWKKQADRIRIANGEMTPEEYMDKWGK